jgi:hypothetical protein
MASEAPSGREGHENAVAPCSNATLEGTFVTFEAGSTMKGNELVPYAGVGYVKNANGKADGRATYIVNGEIAPPEPYHGEYTVNPDCTGTATFNGTEYALRTTPMAGCTRSYRPNRPGLCRRGLHCESNPEPLSPGGGKQNTRAEAR